MKKAFFTLALLAVTTLLSAQILQIEHDGHVYYGFGANTDIVTGSVEAYIDCINKFQH